MGALAFSPETGIFTWAGSYEERLLPKEAGFEWHRDRKVWFTPELRRALKLKGYAVDTARGELAEYERRIARSRATAPSPGFRVPAPAGQEFLPFQLAGVECIALAKRQNARGMILADEMGLGKTVQAIGFLNLLREQEGRAVNALVLCPKSLIGNWQFELRRWGLPGVNVAAVSYDACARRFNEYSGTKYDVILADEAHYLKSPRAKRTKAARALKTSFWLPMTGTPIPNRPIELFTLLSLVDPYGWGRDYHDFGLRFAGAYQNNWGWQYDGASNLDELREYLRSGVMVRRLKADVLPDLPAKVRQVVPLPVEGKAKALVQAEQRAWERVVQEHGYERAVALMESGGAIGFEELSKHRMALAEMKLEPCVEYLRDELENADQIVVFAEHRVLINGLTDALAEFGVVRVDGSTDEKGRRARTECFQAGLARVFVGQTQAAGVGLTLTAASNVYVAELPWRPDILTQAEDRCHRIGQKDTVFCKHLVFDGSLDASMARRIISKQAIADAALDRREEVPGGF